MNRIVIIAAACASFLTGSGRAATTATYTQIASFDSGRTTGPYSQLAIDPQGNLFGTTHPGTSSGSTLFEVKAGSGAVTPLATLGGNAGGSRGAPVIGLDGYIYGTTSSGSASAGSTFYRVPDSGTPSYEQIIGVTANNYQLANGATADVTGRLFAAAGLATASTVGVYELAGQSGGTAFHPGLPYAAASGLTLGGDGLYYGTATYDGGGLGSIVYTFNPTTDMFTTVAAFAGRAYGGVTFDAAGNLFGTELDGGYGRVYEIGAVTHTVEALGFFYGGNGALPTGDLVLGQDGLFYGTTIAGGANGGGTVFSYASDTRQITTLVSFAAGANPQAGLTVGSDGTLYGTTYGGGDNGYGAVFKLSFTNDATPAVPEPASWALMAVGFAAIGGALRDRQRRAAAAV